ncbi:MAG: VOC family protein [Rhodospirillales bacterium]|nr:VOC family protein [Rhodospirillales bacterium]
MTLDTEPRAPLVPELVCSDLERSLAFHCDVPGFRVLHSRDDPPFVYLEREHAEVMLEAWHADVRFTGALTKTDHKLFREPEGTWYAGENVVYGQRELLVQDPDGYLPGFCQEIGKRPIGEAA